MNHTVLVNEIYQILLHIKKMGEKHIWFDFDEEADVLYVSFERPQNASDTDVLEDGTFLRLRGEKIVGLTIMNVSQRK
jgi:uncharacterized protein YuzE